MSAATATAPAEVPAPGWYPDPHGPVGLRWWDGAAWTNLTTDPLGPEPEPRALHVFADAVLDAGDGTEVPVDDEGLEDMEPIEFTWADPADLFEVTVTEMRASEEPFASGARPDEPNLAVVAEPTLDFPTLPVYESPLATIASPVSVRVEVPVRVEIPVSVAPASEPAPAAEVLSPPPAPPVAAPRRKVALAGTGAVVAVAAAAALATNFLTGDPAPKGRSAAAAGPALSAPARACMKEWNTTLGGGMDQLRVTLGQFQGAFAQVAPVKPLPGTVMAADSCALTVNDPSSDTQAVFVSGVKDQVGYLDVTSYPRAARYGYPKSTRQANVTIRPDGSLRAL